jgi:hypothetical protein
VRAAGFRLVSDARLDTIHHGDPETLTAVFRSELWRGRDNLKVSLKGPTTWRTLATALISVVDVVLAGVAFAGAAASAAGWLPGIPITLASVALFVAGAAAKVVRARQRDAAPAAGLVETLVVACVYDVARALALFTRAPHRGALRTPASSAT